MARNDHSGFPMKWFKDQNAARHAYECAICLEVVEDAVQVRNCGHQFCALCIDDILKVDPRCPSCRIKISDAMVFEDHAARRLIKQLEVNCCNEGCTWTGCLSSLLQGHQNSCNFLIQRDDDNAQKLKVEELEQKHDTLMLKVLFFEQKHEQDITELKVKHLQDIRELELKHEEDIKELHMKHEKEKQDIRELQMKHETEKQDIRELQMKHEKEKQDIRELQMKLQQTENIWQQMMMKEKEMTEKPVKNVKQVEIVPAQSDKEKIDYDIKVKKENDAAPATRQTTRRKYERDFLLQFQYMPVCCEKPAGLPEIEVVLDGPVKPNQTSGSKRGQSRRKTQGGGGRRDNRGEAAAPVGDLSAKNERSILDTVENRNIFTNISCGETDEEVTAITDTKNSKEPTKKKSLRDVVEDMNKDEKEDKPPTVMMPGQRQGPYITGHPMAMGPRPMRGRGPVIYSSSPQGPYGQPVMRPYIPNVQQAYQMQATTGPFQPQYIQQQPQYFNQGIPQTMYYMANNQQMQQQQQQQQQQPPAQTTNPPIITTNANKPKQKRTSKLVIRDPKNDYKDITDEILSVYNNTANGRQSGTPPSATSTAQTELSIIQAQFAAQVAARVGEKRTQVTEEKKLEIRFR